MTEHTINQALNYVAQGNIADFKECVSEILTAKAIEAIDVKRVEVATSYMTAQPVTEEVELVEKDEVAGWIAFYNQKKLEIKIGVDAKDLFSAKEFAMKHFKVPKSKRGLLAIQVAYKD
jgi:hypothetical protein